VNWDQKRARQSIDGDRLAIYGYHMMAAIKTTVYLDASVYRRLKVLAQEQGRTAAELIREAVAAYADRQHTSQRPASLGAGRSGRRDLSERAEDLLIEMGRDR